MMNIRLTMEELKALINKIEKAVPKKPSLNILECIRLKATNNKLIATATDCDIELNIIQEAEVLTEGTCYINLMDIKKLLKLKADYLTIKHQEDDGKIYISTGKKVITLTAADCEVFPEIDYKSSVLTDFLTIQADQLADILKRISYYVEDATLYNHNDMLNSFNFNRIHNRITGLDGKRIAIRNNIEGFNPNNNNDELNIQKDFYIKLERVLKAEENNYISIMTSEDNKYIVISGKSFIMAIQRVSGQYFKIDSMLSRGEYSFTINNIKELKEAADYDIKLKGSEDKKPLILSNIEGIVSCTMSCKNGDSYDILNVTDNELPEGYSMGFNPQFLSDLCITCTEDNLHCEVTNSKSPLYVYEKDYTFLILPVNIIATPEEIITAIKKLADAA